MLASPVLWLEGGRLAESTARVVWQAATVLSAPAAVIGVALGDRSRVLLRRHRNISGRRLTVVATVLGLLACATYGAELLVLR